MIQFHTWEDSWVDDDRWAKKLDDLKRQGLNRGGNQLESVGTMEWRARSEVRAD